MHTYEIEIKSLLGNKESADQLIAKMQTDPSFQSLGSHKQLNHYFTGNNTAILSRIAIKHASKLKNAKNISVRTRWADGRVLLVIKASVDDTTSSNGIARIEIEEPVDLSLEQLDQMLINNGFQYQAKWSRERQEFKYKDLNVSVDKNAGYGYLAEFEKVIDDQSKADGTKTFIRDSMKALGVEELPQDRLERMFAFYNSNWQDYYGTDKTFTVE